MTDFAMKEWTGLFAYWLAGYTLGAAARSAA